MFFGTIKSLESYGNGWIWTLNTEIGERTYRTNRDGEGLFYINSVTGMAHQDAGTCQWSLSRARGHARRQIIKRFLEGAREIVPGSVEHRRIQIRRLEEELEYDAYSPRGENADTRRQLADLRGQLAALTGAVATP